MTKKNNKYGILLGLCSILSLLFLGCDLNSFSQPTPPEAPTIVEPTPADDPIIPVEPTPLEEPLIPVEPIPPDDPIIPVEATPADDPIIPVEATPADDPIIPVEPTPADDPLIPVEPTPPEDAIIPEFYAAVALNQVGLPNLFRVSDELYRSGQPTSGGLLSASSLGIQSILSLQSLQLDGVLEEVEVSGLTLLHVPMFPWDIPETQLVKALRAIDQAQKPVLVHCLHGSDRTGLVVAAYRVLFQNVSPQVAISEMQEEAFGYHESFDNILLQLEIMDWVALKAEVFLENP